MRIFRTIFQCKMFLLIRVDTLGQAYSHGTPKLHEDQTPSPSGPDDVLIIKVKHQSKVLRTYEHKSGDDLKPRAPVCIHAVIKRPTSYFTKLDFE